MSATAAVMPLSDTVAWARIASAYSVVEPVDVRRFLAEHAGAADALIEGREAMRAEFGAAPVRLSVEREPDERDGALLFATVDTDATVDDAQRRLRRLDAVWQAALPPQVRNVICLDVRFGC